MGWVLQQSFKSSNFIVLRLAKLDVLMPIGTDLKQIKTQNKTK